MNSDHTSLLRIPFFTYTHSNCKDVWYPYSSRLSRFAKGIPNTFMVDQQGDMHSLITYSDTEPYWKEYVRCLSSLGTKYFIYMQEDFILYNKVDTQALIKYTELLESTTLSFIRLIRTGHVSDIKIADNLYLISERSNGHMYSDCFSMQPTIWKTEKFIELYNECKATTFGERLEYTRAMNKLKINGAYHYSGESARGGHFDSNVFPYIATAIIRRKWNYSEYPNELDSVFKEYNIDKNIRGCI